MDKAVRVVFIWELHPSEPVVPPVVRYKLSESGARLHKVLHAMAEWVIEERKIKGLTREKLSEFPDAGIA